MDKPDALESLAELTITVALKNGRRASMTFVREEKIRGACTDTLGDLVEALVEYLNNRPTSAPS